MKKLKFKNDPKEKEFYNTLRSEVFAELGENLTKYGSLSFWMKGAFWTTICYTSYYLLLQSDNQIVFWLLYLAFQISGLLIGFSLGHDASHNTTLKNKSANQALHFISFLTVGIDPLLWGLRHIRSHHIYANVEGSDIDIDKNPFLRLSPSHPWTGRHKYQHIYAPFVYMLALLHSVFMGDWIYLFSKDYDWMKKGVPKPQLYLRFFLFKIFYFFLVLFIPVQLTGFSPGFILFTYVTASAFTSLLFVIMLVGTHFFEEADYFEPQDNTLDYSWAVHQLKTSCDWNPENRFARIISGGANCHAAHHLFPTICHTNYDRINKIIEKVTKEYHYPYHKMSLWQMMVSHFRHLKKMGIAV